ncbi:MAG: hypothetical protein M1834_000275 [Cirrosporium novae-zelandiae]|nr:MAG: hypothetical protein M1834_000275 [Cirrosporium novae-zelandiae]
MATLSNASSDLVWEITRTQNCYLVKKRQGGGVQFSRDPLNVMNKHSRKYDGTSSLKAVGVQPGDKGGIVLTTKREAKSSQPKENRNVVSLGPNKSNRKIYKGVSSYVAKNSYRPDLRQAAVGRVSAILKSQRPQKEDPERKLRGAKARRAAEKDA